MRWPVFYVLKSNPAVAEAGGGEREGPRGASSSPSPSIASVEGELRRNIWGGVEQDV